MSKKIRVIDDVIGNRGELFWYKKMNISKWKCLN